MAHLETLIEYFHKAGAAGHNLTKKLKVKFFCFN